MAAKLSWFGEAADRFDEIAVGLRVARHRAPSIGMTLKE
jgi:hypothetical protein